MKSPLKAERERRGWTIEHVAGLVGVSGAQISRIETFGVKATEVPQKIVEVFGNIVTLDQICAPDRYTVRVEVKEEISNATS